jgi:hypothetical protein
MEGIMGKHEGDSKKDQPFKPPKPEPDTQKGGDGKHSRPGGKK